MTTFDEPQTGLQQLTDELAVARAAALARAGDHAGALAALAAAPGPPTAGRLDLTARIHAQLGEFDAADDAWRRAAALGGDGAFRAERDRLAAERGQRGGRRPAGWWWPLLAALLAVALAVTLTVLVLRPAPVDGTALAEVRSQQAEIARGIGELRAERQPAQEVLAPVEADLAAPPALLVRTDPGQLVVAFADSPFGGAGAQLSPDGDAAVAELGRRLAPHADRTTLRVVGHADATTPRPGGEFADNESLALARALAAARRLAESSGSPLESIAIATAGAERTPFPGEAGPANRTVTVEIEPVPAPAG